MARSRQKAVIVGAGVIGASIARHLTQRGLDVCVIEMAAGPAMGTTGSGFGWINLINGDPVDTRGFDLRKAAVVEHDLLKCELPSAYPGARRGSIVWTSDRHETERRASVYSAAGVELDILARNDIEEREPHLRAGPDCALLCSRDIAIDTVALTSALLEAAARMGARTMFGNRVVALEMSGARVTGVRLEDKVVPADVIIVAAGHHTATLLSPLGIHLRLRVSPALILRFSYGAPLMANILQGPGLEIRQAHDCTLLVAKSLNGSADLIPQGLVEEVTVRISERFDLAGPIALQSAKIGHRPMFEDGMPRLGFLTGVDGLYVAVGHPGVILAPLLGRFSAEEIVDGRRSALLE